MMFIGASPQYNSSLTAEQFLFYEIRIVSKLYMERKSTDRIIEFVQKDSLFQYPTERKVSKLARACYRRLAMVVTKSLFVKLRRPRFPCKADKPVCDGALRLSRLLGKLTEQLQDVSEFEEKVHHLADMRIQIDLDDGVRHNSELFSDVLAKI